MSISHVCFFWFFLIFQCRTCRLSFHARKGKWKDGNSQTVHYSGFLDTQTSWPRSSLGKIKEQSLASVNYSVWFNRAHSSFFFIIIALFATIGVYIVHLVMAVINCSFPLLLHEPSRSGFRHKRLIAITAISARKRRPLFSQSKYVMKLTITTNRQT